MRRQKAGQAVLTYNGCMKQIGLIIGLLLIFMIGLWQQFYRMSPLETLPAREITLQVAGGVVRPGVYTLAQDARMMDLIEQAGGLSDTADANRINLAQKLIDGDKIVIAERVPVTSEGGEPIPLVIEGLSRNLNDWLAVPGVGPATAERILDYLEDNPHATLDDLINVSGIGPKKHADILDYFKNNP